MAAPITPNGSRKSDKHWRDALIIAAKRTLAETEALLADPKAPMIARAAARVVMASSSDDVNVAAAKEMGDRIDGKPKQQTEFTAGEDADGNPIPVGIAVSFHKSDG